MKSILAAIVASVLSILGGHQVANHAAQQPAATAPAVQQVPANALRDSGPTTTQPVFTPSPSTSIYQPASVGAVLGTSTKLGTQTDFITQLQLQTRLDQLANNLRQTIYQNSSAPGSLPATGGFTNNLALTNRIDKLTGAQLFDVSVSGLSGLTAADIPTNITASNYLPLAGGTMTGAIVNSSTATSSFAGAVTIGTTTPYGALTVDSTVRATGTELITNGAFAGSAAGWTLGNNVVYGTNNVTSTYAGGDPTVSTTFSTVSGNTYLLTFTVSAANGPVTYSFTHNSLDIFNGPFENRSVKVAFTTNFTGTETITFDNFTTPYAGTTWTLSNVSIKQIAAPTPALTITGYDGSTWLELGDDFLGNTALGDNAFYSNINGSLNTAIGTAALHFNTNGVLNTAVGDNALYANTTGLLNTAVGVDSVYSNTTGNFNTGLGVYSLYFNTTGSNNTAVGGYKTMLSNTTGSNNTAVGYKVLYSSVTGSNNTAVGWGALLNNVSATSTTAFGVSAAQGTAIYSNQGGTYLGYQSGNNASTGSDYNTLLGYQAGFGITTGSNNIWLGTATSSTSIANLTTGSQNILIGNNVSLPSATASGQLDIGNIIYGTGITGTGGTLSSGNVGISTTTPNATFVVNGSSGKTLFQIATSTNQNVLVVDQNGSVGVGVVPGGLAAGEVVEIAGNAGSTAGTFRSNLVIDDTTPTAQGVGAGIRFRGQTNFGNTTLAGIWAEKESASGGSTSGSLQFMTRGANTNSRMSITSAGLVGIATTTPWRTLSVTGTVGLDGLGAITGTNSSLCLDGNKQVVYSSNSDSCASSLRSTKHDIQNLDLDVLAQVSALQPVSFVYNNDASSTVRYGFIAEDAAVVDPHLATHDQTGAISGIDDRGVLALLVGGVQKLIGKVQALSDTVSGFALEIVSAHVSARVGDFDQVNTKNLCLTSGNGPVCVTADQLSALLSNSGQQAATAPTAQTDNVGKDTPVVVPSDRAADTATSTP